MLLSAIYSRWCILASFTYFSLAFVCTHIRIFVCVLCISVCVRVRMFVCVHALNILNACAVSSAQRNSGVHVFHWWCRDFLKNFNPVIIDKSNLNVSHKSLLNFATEHTNPSSWLSDYHLIVCKVLKLSFLWWVVRLLRCELKKQNPADKQENNIKLTNKYV